MFWQKQQNEHTFWSERKLLVLYLLLRKCEASKERSIRPNELLTCSSFPNARISASWEGIRLLKLLLNLEAEGVKVKDVFLDLSFFNAIQPNTEILDLPQLKNFFSKKTGSEVVEFNPDKFRQLFAAIPWLDKEGRGSIPPNLESMPVSTLLAACGFFRLHLDVGIKRLRAVIQRYLSQYILGELTNLEHTRKVRPLKAVVGRSLLLTHVNQLRLMQNDPLLWTFGEDGFAQTLETQNPEVHHQWRSGKLGFRFFEALLSLEQSKDIEITGIQNTLIDLEKLSPISRYGLNRVQVQTEIQLSLARPDLESPSKRAQEIKRSDAIEIIQIVKTQTDRFEVYLNYHPAPLLLSKKRKNGELLYRLAEHGKVKYNQYFARTFETIQTDPRFIFFSKTKYKQMPLMELDEHQNIRPVEEVKIELVDYGQIP